MNWLLLSRMLGLLGMLVGGAMALSLPWAFPLCGQARQFEVGGFWGLAFSMAGSLAVGATLYAIGRRETATVLRKEALAVVGLGWILAGLLGSLPYLFSGTMRAEGVPMTLADALFESISGFTTTGASVLTDVENPDLVPRSVLFWRSFTHWLGGMGIIVLFVALLRQLGAGGKVLVRHEVSGPVTENVRPRIRDTAIAMWSTYMGLSLLGALVLWAEGLSVYDSLCHTFGAIATGGFSTYNQSIGHFQSPMIEVTIIVMMILGGTNFALYYLALFRPRTPGRRGPVINLRRFFQDAEYRAYLALLLLATAVLTINLLWRGPYDTPGTALRDAAFTAVSIMTATGYATANFATWSEFSKGLLLLLMFIGGSAGSTSGGTKVIRVILFIRIIRLEIEQAFRPKVVRTLRLAGRPVDPALRHDVVVYVSFVLLIFVSGWMLLAAFEPTALWERQEHTVAEKLIDAASAVAATFNTVGPGLGVLGPAENYAGFSPGGKMLLTLLMLLGRLEIFAIAVLFFPSFWRVQ